MVPNNTETTSTKKTNTKIFALLALKARAMLLDSPMKRTNFKILNTLNKRSALNAEKYWVLTKKNDRYFGSVESKSIIPKKLNIYLLGLLIQTNRNMYSMEKRIVTTHSDILKKS